MAASSEEFSKRITDIVEAGFVLPRLAIGGQLGLFDKLAELQTPASAQEIADSLGLKERYVREWLKGMAHAQIVTYDCDNQTYYLPRHHIEAVTGFEPVNARGIPVFCQVHEDLMNVFQKDGPNGIAFDKYVGLQEWMADRKATEFNNEAIIKHFSKEPTLLKKLESGIAVVDFGCGTGECMITMAKMFTKSTFYGYDIDAEAITKAKAKPKLENCSFGVANVHNLPDDWSERFDLVTVFDVIHDLPYPDKGLTEIRKVLKPTGCFFMADINLHSDPTKNLPFGHATRIYTASLYHCMPQALFHEGGRGLGSAWGIESAMEMLKETGFVNVRLLGNVGKYADFLAEK